MGKKSNFLKNTNIYRLIWISCIFLVLIVILVMVMDYKINYEYLEENKLYFYNCDESVCATEVEDNDLELYSTYECRYEVCPKFSNIVNEDYVLLSENDSTYELYNYKTGITISAGYEDYEFINDSYIIVTNDNKKGIIDTDDNVIVNLEYEEIGWHTSNILSGYDYEKIVAKKDGMYGIISFKDGSVYTKFTYSVDDIEELLKVIEESD